MNSEQITIDLRRAMGTLPSESPTKQTKIIKMEDSFEVTLEDYSTNPYRSMFVAATSTWGNNQFEQKWNKISPEGKLEVIKAVLTHKTLPQAKEGTMFTFRVARVPRLIFDYHAQTVNFIFFMSQGLRDNNRIDADIIKEEVDGDLEIFEKLKDFYEFTLKDGTGSWQSARAFLPQSYCHSYHFGQNLLSIISTRGFHASGRFGIDYKEQKLLEIYKKISIVIGDKFPLLELYMRMMWKDKNDILNKIKNLKIEDLNKKDLNLLTKEVL